MKCPNDQSTLLITDRSGIEIDYCPECRGVWLDRGELDKIIERGGASADVHGSRDDARYGNTTGYSQDQNHYKKKKRESFLGDLFDF